MKLQENRKQNLQKLLGMLLISLVLCVVVFSYDYYSPEKLDKNEMSRISFVLTEENTVKLESEGDVPFITTIRYTTDGSQPTKDSTVYTEPVPISGQYREGTVIRAAVFRGGKSAQVYTQTFFSQSPVLSNGVYTVSVSTDEDNLYSYEKGIFSLGADTQEEANANENIPRGPNSALRANYYGRGIEWERPANVEIYSPDGEQITNTIAGLRVSGANSRRFVVKSLRLFARKSYGDGTFELQQLNMKTQDMVKPVDEYNHLDLRSGGNNFYYTMLPDTLMRIYAYDSGFDVVGQAIPATVYINGQYYGLMFIQPDYDVRSIAEMAGLHKDSIIRIVKGFEGSATDDTMEGYQDYMNMYDFAYSADFTLQENCDKLEQMLDLDNALMYYAIEMFADNNDWPNNNYGLWRCVDPVKSNPANKYADGRWRFFLYDTDNAFGTFVDQLDGFDHIIGMGRSPMMVNLLKNEDYKNRFINIFCDLLSTGFSKENLIEKYVQIRDIIEPEMVWRDENNRPIDFDEDYRAILLYKMEYFFEHRQDEVYTKIRDYLGKNNRYNLTIDNLSQGVQITLNTQNIHSGHRFEGVYYKDRPAVLTAQTSDGWQFSHWVINGEEYTENPLRLTADVVNGDSCTVTAIATQTDCGAKFSQLSAGGHQRYIDVYNPGINPVQLSEYIISDTPSANDGYQLLDVQLKPDEKLRVYFTDDESAPVGSFKCGINVKEYTTLYLFKNGQLTDTVFTDEYLEGYVQAKSDAYNGWKYVETGEG